VNLLFVNYGDFTTNSLNHIAGFAAILRAAGHDCVVAVPGNLDSLNAIPNPQFRAASYEQLLKNPALFQNGRPADIVHAWTPREGVRRFLIGYRRLAQSRVIIHLEDNEEHLLESYMGRDLDLLREESQLDYPKPLPDALCHPVRHRNLLRLADGVTVIVGTLREFVPQGIPVLSLPPGVDLSQYHPGASHAGLREHLMIRPDERVIVYTGSNTFANEAEIRELFLAVQRLNAAGWPTRLVRTGFSSPDFIASLPADWAQWTIDLGFIEKNRLPGLLTMADVLVQPGAPGAFNDYRLPSKLPEFLASGRPVVTVASNLGLLLEDGVNALILPLADAPAIAEACIRLFSDAALASRLGAGGFAFARKHFDLSTLGRDLAAFYAETLARPVPSLWQGAAPGADVSLAARRLHALLGSRPESRGEGWTEIIASADDLARLIHDLEWMNARHEAATADLRRVLEEERDKWQRAWQLTDQHAKNINETRIATQNHANNLETVANALKADVHRLSARLDQAEVLLKSTRRQTAAYERELIQHERNQALIQELRARHAEQEMILDEARQRIIDGERMAAELAGRIASRDTSLAQAAYQLAHTRASALALGERARAESDHLRQLLRDREEALDARERKVHAMQASLSWQITAPLRALRRWLIDPLRRRSTSTAGAKPALRASTLDFRPDDFADVSNAFVYSIDYPQTWSFAGAKVVVRGWCLSRSTLSLKKIQARVGARTYSGVYGLKRMDVLAALRDTPQAEYSGFKVEVALEEADSEIVLEVADAHGIWHPFFRSPVRVGAHLAAPELTSYERWVDAYDRPTPESLAALAARVPQLRQRPLISILVPVYHRSADDERWLRRAVDSVRHQVYPHWELCLADDASPAPHVRPLLEEFMRQDPRIKAVFRERNGHISHASNSALGLATGEFTALLDHDDELAPHALYEVASLLDVHPDTDLVYSDEDKIDEEGRRHEPYFKPDYLPDLFKSQNYLSHLSVYRTSLLRAVDGFRPGYEGSQDWDLALRVIERSSPERIRHIPKVLYHWRAILGSTALMLSEKNYPVEAAKRALTDHFQRLGESVELIPVPGDHWRARRPRPEPAPLVSIIIPTRNGHHLISRCIDTLVAKTLYPNYEILVIDNGSDEPATLDYFRQIESDRIAVLRYDAPFNYSAINNHGIRHARGSIVALLNNDLEIIHGEWLDEMVSQAVRPEIGCVGALLYYPNDTIQHAGVAIGMGGVAGHLFRDFPRGTDGRCNRARLTQNFSAVTAACLVVRRDVFEKVGGLDESLAVAFNDIDFCLRVRATGLRNLWTPFAELYHHESASRGAEDTPEKHERFRREVEIMLARWKDVIAHDPAYNPNLSLELTDYSLAAPPRVWSP
jgi:GT2 family glycosyltransferase/glycosyltransferase involved in cell wall biosynthesis